MPWPQERGFRLAGGFRSRRCLSPSIAPSQHCFDVGAGDRGRTGDVQLGNMGNVLFSVIQLRTALIQGMKNANKTRVRFHRHVNGGFLEGAIGGWRTVFRSG